MTGDESTRKGDAGPERRTVLANERTQLAWWRTGLTALAVALGVGRVVPELAPRSTTWPYTVVGIGFAIYGIVLFAYGTRRRRGLDRELGVAPPPRSAAWLDAALAVAGVALGLAIAALIVFE